jgi:hypothetical protein
MARAEHSNITIVEGPFTDRGMLRMRIPVESGHPSELCTFQPDGSVGERLGYRMETDEEFRLHMIEDLTDPSKCLAWTDSGRQCSRLPFFGVRYCKQHYIMQKRG